MAEIAQEKTNALHHRRFNWRLLWLLTALAAIGMVAILPYDLTLKYGGNLPTNLPLPLPLLLIVQVASQVVLFAILIAVGLLLAGQVGLGAPLLADWLKGEPVAKRLKALLLPSVLWGVLGTAVVALADVLLFAPRVQAMALAAGIHLPANANPPAWQGLLAALYGAINEEIMLRLFFMTLLVWLFSRFWHTSDRLPTAGAVWTGNLLAAVVFGLGHLPATQALGLPINALVVTRAIALNALPGIIFGYLYWKRGFASGMLAHFSGDIVLHVILPLFL